jgi:cytochrome c oxidase subunit 1
MIFSLLTFSVAIPSAIKVFNWLATMYKGSISLTTPMCYSLIFIFLFGLGGLTGLFLGALATDVQVHDTSFVVAHFHYQMVGGVLMAFLSGLHHWWPKITGRMYNDKLGRYTALWILIAFNLTFFPQFILGSHGMPRRYFDYTRILDQIPALPFYQAISTIGGVMFVAGLATVAVYLIQSLRKGSPAPANPWGGATMEWQTSSPPPPHNFKKAPQLADPYDFDRLHYDEQLGGYVTVS